MSMRINQIKHTCSVVIMCGMLAVEYLCEPLLAGINGERTVQQVKRMSQVNN